MLFSSQTEVFGISGQIFGVISAFFSNRPLWVVLDENSSQEYPVNAGLLQGSILGPTLFLSYILMTCLMMLSIILLSILMILLSNLFSTVKTASKALINFMKFLSPEVALYHYKLCICIFLIKYKNRSAEMLVLHLLPLLNPWHTIKM